MGSQLGGYFPLIAWRNAFIWLRLASPTWPYCEIDWVLAKHYGFTDGELDFIINYDITYRMGGADDGEED